MLGSCRMIFSLSKKETGIKKRQKREVGRERKGRRQPAHHGSPSRTITLDPGTSTYHFAVTQIFSPHHPKHSCLGIHRPGFYYHLHPSICSCSYLLSQGMPSVLQSKTRWFGWCYSNLVQTKGLQCAFCLPGPWRPSSTGISPLHSDSVLLKDSCCFYALLGRMTGVCFMPWSHPHFLQTSNVPRSNVVITA